MELKPRPRQLRILIVEDAEPDTQLMLLEMRRGNFLVAARQVESEDQFREALKEPTDAILCDYALPQFSALRALDICTELNVDVPFIVVSGSVSDEVAVDCMKRGAADYLLKDRLARLGSAVEQAIGAKSLRDERAKSELALAAAVRELEHRVRNNLALVLRLIPYTAAPGASVGDYTQALERRVLTLTMVQDALAEKRWVGADLYSLIERTIRIAHPEVADRVHISGDPLLLPSRAAAPIALAFHELINHAAEHGSLRDPAGSVRVAWNMTGTGGTRLRWEEPSATPGLPLDRRCADFLQGLVKSEIRVALAFRQEEKNLVAEFAIEPNGHDPEPCPVTDAGASRALSY